MSTTVLPIHFVNILKFCLLLFMFRHWSMYLRIQFWLHFSFLNILTAFHAFVLFFCCCHCSTFNSEHWTSNRKKMNEKKIRPVFSSLNEEVEKWKNVYIPLEMIDLYMHASVNGISASNKFGSVHQNCWEILFFVFFSILIVC